MQRLACDGIVNTTPINPQGFVTPIGKKVFALFFGLRDSPELSGIAIDS